MKNLSALTSLPEIIQCDEDFQKHFEKIDKLQIVLNAINEDLTALEQNVTKAEEDLGFNNSGFKGFLKPWFGMASSKGDKAKAEDGAASEPAYRHSLTFKSSDYFGDREHMLDSAEL